MKLELMLDSMELELMAHRLGLEELLHKRGWMDHNREKELIEQRMGQHTVQEQKDLGNGRG